MGIDLSSVNWTFVGLMTALAFVTALLGSLIAFRNRFAGAIIAAILFAIGFVAWNYYPHAFGLPILKSTTLDGVVAPAAAAPPAASAPATPAPPANPVTPMAPEPSQSSPPPSGTH
jgi:hypothetical protein